MPRVFAAPSFLPLLDIASPVLSVSIVRGIAYQPVNRSMTDLRL
jgi:hypothetical protein